MENEWNVDWEFTISQDETKNLLEESFTPQKGGIFIDKELYSDRFDVRVAVDQVYSIMGLSALEGTGKICETPKGSKLSADFRVRFPYRIIFTENILWRLIPLHVLSWVAVLLSLTLLPSDILRIILCTFFGIVFSVCTVTLLYGSKRHWVMEDVVKEFNRSLESAFSPYIVEKTKKTEELKT